MVAMPVAAKQQVIARSGGRLSSVSGISCRSGEKEQSRRRGEAERGRAGAREGALVAVSAAGLQCAGEGQRAADAVFATVSLAVSFACTTGDPLEDTGGRDVCENRRDGPLLRKTSALTIVHEPLNSSTRSLDRFRTGKRPKIPIS
eukprot:3083616-Prymnesium_polylepis.1